MKWYALFVETGQEDFVQKNLRLHFDESDLYSVVPKRRLPERRGAQKFHVLREMFPGYVFIRTRMDTEMYYRLKEIPRCFRVLNNQGTYYSPIQDHEMAPIMRLIGNGEIIDYSQVVVQNSRVIVQSGPLFGLEDIIKKVDKRKSRAKILVNLMDAERLIDVGLEIVHQPLHDESSPVLFLS